MASFVTRARVPRELSWRVGGFAVHEQDALRRAGTSRGCVVCLDQANALQARVVRFHEASHSPSCGVSSDRGGVSRRYAARFILLALCLVIFAGACFAGDQPLAAQSAQLAPRSLLIDIAGFGSRWIVVGERGHILTSDDRGRSWAQARRVPVQALLTGVCFFDARRGIAVGHDEAILSTSDAGETWALKHYAPEKQQPLLDVYCGEGGHAIAVGAYSSFYESRDGGATWSLRAPPLVSAKPVAAVQRASPNRHAPADQGDGASTPSAATYDEDIPQDYHFNRIIAASATRLYIAAEAGHIYRSDDAGASWMELPSPYSGSFFGALALSDNEVLVFGLRGNLFRSSDAGNTWQRIETHTTAMLNDGVRLNDSSIAIVGLSGVVLTSNDDGRTFKLHQQPNRKGASAVWPIGAGAVEIVGEGGARSWPTGAANP